MKKAEILFKDPKIVNMFILYANYNHNNDRTLYFMNEEENETYLINLDEIVYINFDVKN